MVVAERKAGKTYTQIAAAKNVKASTVVEEALKVRATVLTAKVKSGAITQAQADAAAANMKTRLTERVDSVNTSCDGTGSGSGGGRGSGGQGRRPWHGLRRQLHGGPVGGLPSGSGPSRPRLNRRAHQRVPAVGYSRSGPHACIGYRVMEEWHADCSGGR